MKIGIIGGGISGVICAIKASVNNDVTILEGNDKLLKKLLLTGNGKCNYFNDDQNINNYHSEESLEDIITKDNIEKVKSFYDEIGIIPKIKNGYYYPTSNTANSVREALLKELENNNVKIKYNYKVNKIEKQNESFIINDELAFDKLVISTGSCAYPKTGSDGSGYKLLEDLNLKIVKPLPSLTPLIIKEKFKWAGIRCDAKISLYENNNYITEQQGELQLTDYGVSGICIFNLSSLASRGLDKNKEEVIKINFLPFVDNVKEFLLERNSKLKNRNILELLEGVLNYKLVNVLLDKAGIKSDLSLTQLTDLQFNNLVETLSSLSLQVIDTKKYDYSQVCSGGLSLSEINKQTMETKINGLYVIGELLDIDGLCGGYNITVATLSGILAGENV